jgi:hypothetical protein
MRPDIFAGRSLFVRHEQSLIVAAVEIRMVLVREDLRYLIGRIGFVIHGQAAEKDFFIEVVAVCGRV